MNTIPVKKEQNDELVQYVEALASKDDYWLSVTDASRICKVQDVTLRRAINKGTLPVRRERAGQNKRTRFVRASDLPKAGYPIIDESAAITQQVGKADILNIPKQQQLILDQNQRISEEYTLLMTRVAEVQSSLDHYQSEVRQQLVEQGEQFQSSLRTMQEEFLQQLAAAEERQVASQQQLRQDLASAEKQFTEGQQGIRQDLDDTEKRLSNVQQGLRQDLTQVQADAQQQEARHQEALRTQHIELTQTMEKHREQARLTMERFVTEQQKIFQAYQQTVDTAVQRVEQTALERFKTLEGRIEAEGRERATQMRTLGEQVEAMKGAFQKQIKQVQGDLSTWRQRSTEESEQVTAEQQRQRTSFGELERRVAEQKAQLDRYAQLLPLVASVADLQLLLAERRNEPRDRRK